MIHKIECVMVECDNCGNDFESSGSGFTIFMDKDSAQSCMDDDWYVGMKGTEHEDKHYCSECFKYDENVDDVIIIDETRKDLHRKK